MTQQVFEELLEIVRRQRRRRRERVARILGLAPTTPYPVAPDDIDVRTIRGLTGLSQAKFAELIGIGLATLRNWEQGRRQPTGPARALLRAIHNSPVEVIKALTGQD